MNEVTTMRRQGRHNMQLARSAPLITRQRQTTETYVQSPLSNMVEGFPLKKTLTAPLIFSPVRGGGEVHS
jgi:hypothetical protein